MTDRSYGIYRLFAEDMTLLYVGMSGRWASRMHEHQATQPWWSEVRATIFEPHVNEPSARAAETQAIKTEHPKYNKTHNIASIEPRYSWDALHQTPQADALKLVIERLAPGDMSAVDALNEAARTIARLEREMNEIGRAHV